ncbi:DUF1223 domain-containing protein [Nordella sp. HKS 07]|uniref:DUF1223 domain-containing protein n=1 Tax=Nordella sp. HKS 07 TaxID=2712222 RepID=UPI0013E132E2|nr:DUF1223 domain-containing protein [Nordella sp. HKS 07]QIG47631.1 DUF1223 domain-containing protein [Nordella sp. HKS 07]
MQSSLELTRRQVLALAAGAVAAGATGRIAKADGVRPAVVELFTSQGCSSCPPADAFMEEVRAMKDVVALTYNVDYWDYRGWRDTLASPENSKRQYKYAKARGDMDVYTPQMIIDGVTHVVGSQKSAVISAIRYSLSNPPPVWIPVSIFANDAEFQITVDESPADTPVPAASLWFVSVAPRIPVEIEKGENAGQNIVYLNVVRKLVPVGMWHGDKMTLALPKDSVMTEDSTSCVALLQMKPLGRILGCATWGRLNS